jgi:hypothetical protein
MGFPVPPGQNVPAWLVDAGKLEELLTRLTHALERPPSFSASLNPSLLAYDRASIGDSISAVSESARQTHVELRQALTAFSTASVDRAHQARLTSLVNELTTLWSVRATMTLGMRRSAVLRRLLGDPAPDLLGVIRREDDENSHSDVLRWLLDPRKAPKLAPVALRALVGRFREAERWRTALAEGIALGCVSVRREVIVGYDMGQDENRARIDLVVSGPDFVIGIENKVWSLEHDEQTHSYSRWLDSLRVPLKAGIFLTPSGMPAASSSFRPFSYLELVGCLLEAPTADTISPREERVLAGYLHTLRRRILRAEFNAILELEGQS